MSASAIRRTSIASLRSVGQGSPSAAGIPLLKTKTSTITKTTKLRDGFMLRHCSDARIFSAWIFNPWIDPGRENRQSRKTAPEKPQDYKHLRAVNGGQKRKDFAG